jgi:hypothetical protein
MRVPCLLEEEEQERLEIEFPLKKDCNGHKTLILLGTEWKALG